jgi:hypothetical protein
VAINGILILRVIEWQNACSAVSINVKLFYGEFTFGVLYCSIRVYLVHGMAHMDTDDGCRQKCNTCQKHVYGDHIAHAMSFVYCRGVCLRFVPTMICPLPKRVASLSKFRPNLPKAGRNACLCMGLKTKQMARNNS